MIKGDIYTHFKGGQYHILGIAHPISELSHNENIVPTTHALDASMEEPQMVTLFKSEHDILYIDRDGYYVVYESISMPDGSVPAFSEPWVRELDEFMGTKKVEEEPEAHEVKRFVKVKEEHPVEV